MDTLAIVRRDLLLSLRSSGVWAAGLGLTAYMLLCNLPADPAALWLMTFLTVLACVCSGYRTMLAERSCETVEHLAATPLGALSIVLQVSVACMIVWNLAFLVPAGLAVGRDLLPMLPAWATGVALSGIGAAYGCMAAFRFGHLLWGRLSGGFLSATLAVYVASIVIIYLDQWEERPIVMPQAIAAALLGLVAIWRIWRLCGGDWPESLASTATVPSSPIEERIERIQGGGGWWGPVPDCVGPVIWREVHRGLPTAWAIGLAGAVFVLWACLQGRDPIEPYTQWFMAYVAGLLGWVPVTVISAARTARDREEGVWDHLTATPLSARALAGGKILGILALALVSVLPCFLMLALLARWNGEAVLHLVGAVLALALVWLSAIVAGFLGGAMARGWKGSLLALGIASVCSIGWVRIIDIQWRLVKVVGFERAYQQSLDLPEICGMALGLLVLTWLVALWLVARRP